MQHRLTVFTLNWVQKAAMDRTTKLTLEQEFSLRRFADQVQQMSRKPAQFLFYQYKHMMLRKTMYQLKQDWIERDFGSL